MVCQENLLWTTVGIICIFINEMDKKKLAEEIKSTALLRGNFILRSGRKAEEYFDKYLFESSPDLLKAVVFYLKKLIPSDTQILAGLEMGGIPLVTALSMETGLPCAFVRKKAKSYGTKKISEGALVKNKRVCVVEDVVTTGGQLIISVGDLRKAGAVIEQAVCVIYRGEEESLKNIQSQGLRLQSVFTYKDIV